MVKKFKWNVAYMALNQFTKSDNTPTMDSIFNDISSRIPSINCEALLVGGGIILIIILMVETIDWNYWLNKARCNKKIKVKRNTKYCYGYEDDDGPAVWKDQYEEALGNKQSPINIVPIEAIVFASLEPLIWSISYGNSPEAIRITNDGHCAILHGKFIDRPTITGGPLHNEKYEFQNIRFRWGPCDDEGSEHTIDFRRFALEMQVAHVHSSGTKKSDCSVAIISYLFQITPQDNPYLDPIVSNLKKIIQPNSKCHCPVFPLCWLMPSFGSDYFSYIGSLTHPPCTEGIIWLIQPEPLAISSRQVRKFRKLLTHRGTLISNTRPIQCMNDRDLYYVVNN